MTQFSPNISDSHLDRIATTAKKDILETRATVLTRRHLRRIAVTALSVLAIDCSPGQGPAGQSTVRDSAGVLLVESIATPMVHWRIDELPRFVMGRTTVPGGEPLVRVSDALFVADDRVVILDRGDYAVKVFSSDGKYLWSHGQAGDGPGDYRYPIQLSRFANDSFAVLDQGRRSVYTSRGGYVREDGLDFDALTLGLAGVSPASVLGLRPDGSLLVRAMEAGYQQPQIGLFRIPFVYAVFHPGSGRLDTLGVYRWGHQDRIDIGQGPQNTAPPYGRNTFWGIGADGRIAIGDNARYEVHIFSPAGQLERIVRLRDGQLPLTDDDITAWKDWRLERTSSESRKADLMRLWQHVARFDLMPAFRSLILDEEGNLWVERARRPNDPIAQYDVFNPDGAFLTQVNAPAGLVVLRAGSDYVLGIWRDADDVEYVRAHNLLKP